MGFVLHAHPVRGESHIQHDASREVATTSPPFLHRTAPIVRSFCEGYTWHDLHILVTAPFCCDRYARAASAQSFTLWQQASIEITRRYHSNIACSRHIYTGFLHAHPFRTFNATATERLQQHNTVIA